MTQPVTETPEYRLPIWFHALNMLALMGFAIVLLAFAGSSRFVADDYPYDYGILHYGGEVFCFQPDEFSYGDEYLYPAPFYTTFCAPFHYAPEVLFWLWMLIPFVLIVVLAGQRAAVFVFPPIYIHLLLGQSTWLLLPLFWLAVIVGQKKQVRWWYGLFIPLAIFKPHIALLPLVFLLYNGRKNWLFLLTSALLTLLTTIPAFVLQPNWLIEWLTAGRGFKIPSIANINIIPIQLLQLGEEQTPLVSGAVGQLLVLVFGGMIALLLLWGIRRRRGKLTFYDWVLVFAFANPFMHDYDLIILLPFIANRPKRLLLALTAGLVVWIYAQTTTYYNASIVVTLTLLVARFIRLDDHEPTKPPARW